MTSYCYKCMRELAPDAARCPHCGHAGPVKPRPHHLIPGTLLNDRYLVGAALGQGGFGITYIGLDTVLEERVAVKEYYPSGYVRRLSAASRSPAIVSADAADTIEKGKRRFLQEAKMLALLNGTDGIVGVKDFFEENETAYIVMEYLEGEDLQHYLRHHSMGAEETFARFAPIMDALEHAHAAHVIHRDISPQNIKVLSDGSLRLMDFGAARIVDYDDTHSLSVLLKPGYSPEEQYLRKGKQGPWTDVYALSATMYKCITGVTPDDSLLRILGDEDPVVWPSQMGIEITELQESALRKGMAVRAGKRFRSLGAMKAFLRGEPVPPAGAEWYVDADGNAIALAPYDDDEDDGPATYIPND